MNEMSKWESWVTEEFVNSAHDMGKLNQTNNVPRSSNPFRSAILKTAWGAGWDEAHDTQLLNQFNSEKLNLKTRSS